MNELESISSGQTNLCVSCAGLVHGMGDESEPARMRNVEVKLKRQVWAPVTIPLFAAALMSCAASETPAVPELRLGDDARPLVYSAELVVRPEQSTFAGQITIDLELKRKTSFLWLHGHGLSVTNAYLVERGEQIAARAIQGGEEFLGFEFHKAVKPGKAQLFISYLGAMSDKDYSGLFHRQENEEWYAATQLEATWARRVFPCFDEPAFKVPWRLTLRVKREHTALSNGPILSETSEPDGMKCVRFAETPPLPSYLVAVAVGPFAAIDLGKVGRNNTPLRIFTPKGRTNEAAYAAEVIPQLLRRLENYYDMAYPYEKLDHVALPQFPVAMENAGLITYGDVMLLSPPDRQTIQFERAVAGVSTHEMAHQWFGDLVTMSWWDDLWLNEAFASWLTPKVLDGWKPKWRSGLDQLLGTFYAAGVDSQVNARCIRQPIQTASDIENAFDGITYSKGAAVLGMFEAAVGEEAFQKGIRNYLHRHAWKNATAADFLKALDHAARRDVGAALSTFLDQPGIPLVLAEPRETSAGSSRLLLTQQRYLPIGSTGNVGHQWKIPLGIRYQSSGQERRLGLSLDRAQETVKLEAGTTGLDWVLLNEGAHGYYIAAYRGTLLKDLLQGDVRTFSAAERMSMAHSLSAAVRSGTLPLGEALSLQPAMLRDPERRVVEMATAFMNQREHVPPELQTNFQRFIQRSVFPLVRELSWRSPRPETDDERLQRLALLGVAANEGEDSSLIAEAKRLALAWLQDRGSVPPDEANAVLSVAGRFADSALFAKLVTEVEQAQNPDREWLILAVGACKDRTLAHRALDALAAHAFQPIDSLMLLFALSSHSETRSLTYDYLKQHYAAVTAALPGDSLFWYLPQLAEGFETLEHAVDVETFFKDKDVKLTGGPRIIAQVIESIRLNYAFKEAQLPSLVEFLKRQ